MLKKIYSEWMYVSRSDSMLMSYMYLKKKKKTEFKQINIICKFFLNDNYR